jgi:hypothetical protein
VSLRRSKRIREPQPQNRFHDDFTVRPSSKRRKATSSVVSPLTINLSDRRPCIDPNIIGNANFDKVSFIFISKYQINYSILHLVFASTQDHSWLFKRVWFIKFTWSISLSSKGKVFGIGGCDIR